MNLRENLGSKLSFIAKSQGITQEEISAKTNINRTSISYFFSGKAQLQSDNLLKLLEVLNIDINLMISNKIEESLERNRIESVGQLFDNLIELIPQKHKKRNAIKFVKTLAKQCESKNPKLKHINEALNKLAL